MLGSFTKNPSLVLNTGNLRWQVPYISFPLFAICFRPFWQGNYFHFKAERVKETLFLHWHKPSSEKPKNFKGAQNWNCKFDFIFFLPLFKQPKLVLPVSVWSSRTKEKKTMNDFKQSNSQSCASLLHFILWKCEGSTCGQYYVNNLHAYT